MFCKYIAGSSTYLYRRKKTRSRANNHSPIVTRARLRAFVRLPAFQSEARFLFSVREMRGVNFVAREHRLARLRHRITRNECR